MTDQVGTDSSTGELAFWIEQSDTWKRLAQDERAVTDRLRKVIEESPHDSGCQFSFLPEDKPRRCTCWKAEVL